MKAGITQKKFSIFLGASELLPKKVSVSYFNGLTLGQFQCENCGMKYQRSNTEQVFEEYVEHVTILNYGHYWYEMLRECVEVKKLRLMETATVLKCTTTTVKKRADEIGLNPPPPSTATCPCVF